MAWVPALLAAIFFISDAQINLYDPYPTEQATAVRQQLGPHHVYDCGDITENALPAEYDTYRSIFPNSTPVPGNHDWYDGLAAWPWPTDQVDVMDQGIHLVGFDSALWNDAAALADLQARLDDGPDVFTILFLHHPLFSANTRVGGIARVMRQALLPVVEAADVDLVISGHSHAYERHVAGGRTFLVIGGAGAHLDQLGPSSTLVCGESCHHWLELEPGGAGVEITVHRLGGGTVDACRVNAAEVADRPTTWSAVKRLYR